MNVRVNVRSSLSRLYNSGHSVEVALLDGGSLVFEGQAYEIERIVFRRKSETRINGQQFALEAQIEHRGAESRRKLIVSILFTNGPSSSALLQVSRAQSALSSPQLRKLVDVCHLAPCACVRACQLGLQQPPMRAGVFGSSSNFNVGSLYPNSLECATLQLVLLNLGISCNGSSVGMRGSWQSCRGQAANYSDVLAMLLSCPPHGIRPGRNAACDHPIAGAAGTSNSTGPRRSRRAARQSGS